MEHWLKFLLEKYPDNGNWSARRRQIILDRWPAPLVRAAEQDSRLGKPEELQRYDAEVVMIKAAIPKGVVDV